MFVYWKGYEVDGSATDYNIVVPQRELIAEVLRYFLSLKIIDRNAELLVTTAKLKNQVFKWEEIDKLCELAENPETKTIHVSTKCVHPDQLFPQVRNALYKLSAARPGAEGKNYNYKKPTVNPFYIPALCVDFSVTSLKTASKVLTNYQPEGLIFNQQALISTVEQPHFNLGLICGPGFIYEYAAYLMQNLAERFPEIGIDGGLDCAGGFVDGCTYASDLYSYERILVKNTDIADVLQKLLEAGVIVPQVPSGKYGRDLVDSKQLHLFHLNNIHKAKDEHLSAQSKIMKGIIGKEQACTTDQYEKFVEKIAAIECLNSADFIYYATCCIKYNDAVCAVTCSKQEGEIVLEFRVPSALRQEFVKKLNYQGFSVD